MYRVLGLDNKEYGPVDAGVLRQWIAQGRANEVTRVRVEGVDEWRQLSDLPEFAEALAAGGRPAMQAALETVPPPAPRVSTTLATISLLLGIASLMCVGVLGGIPAIITGHMAHRRARRSPDAYGGGGMAIAGFVMGYLSILTTLIWISGLFLPALSQAKKQTASVNCASQMSQICLATLLWANDHTNTFPATFQSMSNELNLTTLLVCPADSSKTPAASFASLNSDNVSYEYVNPGLTDQEAGTDTLLFRCPIHGHAARSDGRVEMGQSEP